jgi:Kef-type K+ transport system membrane component KefB
MRRTLAETLHALARRSLLWGLVALVLAMIPRAARADSGVDDAALDAADAATVAEDARSDVAATGAEPRAPRASDASLDAASAVFLQSDAAAVAAWPDATSVDSPDGGASAHSSSVARTRSAPTLSQVARTALGLCALLAMVLIAGHRRVAEFERARGLSMFASTGVPFLAVGALCAHPVVGVLNASVLMDLRPALEFGLGWIGLRIGSEFDVREFDRLPRGTTRLLGAETGFSFLLAGGATALALAAFGGSTAAVLLRDAALLGACASVSAPTGTRLLEARGLMNSREAKMLRRVTRLDDAIALIALAVVNAIFHPANGAASRGHLPPLGWVFLQIGMGATLGFVLYAFRATATRQLEQNALTFGVVAFAAGMAGYLGFSPLVVAFVAGVVVTNVTRGRGLGAFGEQLVALERPMFVTFFTIVGATWALGSERAWLVIPLFVLTRQVGKTLGARISFTAGVILDRRRAHSTFPPTTSATPAPAANALSSHDDDDQPLLEVSDPKLAVVALTPSSVVAVAIVISARAQYPDLAPFVLTVVIVGGVLAELVTQLEVARAAQRRAASEDRKESR